MSCSTISSNQKFGLKPKFNNNLCFINFLGILSFINPAIDFIAKNKESGKIVLIYIDEILKGVNRLFYHRTKRKDTTPGALYALLYIFCVFPTTKYKHRSFVQISLIP